MWRLETPVVILTVPKAGTHLIVNLFREMFGASSVDINFLTQERLDEPGFQLENKVYYGHIAFTMANAARLRSARKVLLRRDPRDICVSQVVSMLEKKAPWGIESEIVSLAPTFEELMVMVIAGGDIGGQTMQSMATQIDLYFQRWAALEHTLVDYNDLLPEGDDWSRPARALAAALADLGYEPGEPSVLADIARRGSDPARSATFAHGLAGRWRDLMSRGQLELLAAHTGGGMAPLPGQAEQRRAAPIASASVSVPQTLAGAATRQELARLASLVSRIKTFDDCWTARVSLAEMPHVPVRLLIHTDGALHRALRSPFYGADAFENLARARRIPEVKGAVGAWQPALAMVRGMVGAGLKAHFVDVGCYYGFESILVAAGSSDVAAEVKITAFDCGLAGELAQINFDINGIGDRVRFDKTCIAETERWAVVVGEYGHAENMRIVNRMPQTETFSYPARAAPLDAIIAPEDNEFLVLSVDVNGAETMALQGARRLLREGKVVAAIIKFVPHALYGVGRPTEVFEILGEDYSWHDIGPYMGMTDSELKPIEISFDDFTNDVFRRPADYTKVLAVRRDWADKLMPFATGLAR